MTGVHSDNNILGSSSPNLPGLPLHEGQANVELIKLLGDMREKDRIQMLEIESLQTEVRQMMSCLKGKSRNELKAPDDPRIDATYPLSTIHTEAPQPTQKVEPIKWPAAYDHKDRTEWPTTYVILRYKYQPDVVERMSRRRICTSESTACVAIIQSVERILS
ncbi:hypothetical protein K3495_g17218 [Podosphaera aphanis]|nr:hypothetical protein K3495_g17218 [Podosphaera aphanis]